MISVFVYGTLLLHESNSHVVEDYVLSRMEGTVIGRLVDYGPYPALVKPQADDGIQIAGEWIEVTEEGLRAMDELEGYNGPGMQNDYERVWIHDLYTDREGWIYVWSDARGCPEIPGGSWREHRARQQ